MLLPWWWQIATIRSEEDGRRDGRRRDDRNAQRVSDHPAARHRGHDDRAVNDAPGHRPAQQFVVRHPGLRREGGTAGGGGHCFGVRGWRITLCEIQMYFTHNGEGRPLGWSWPRDAMCEESSSPAEKWRLGEACVTKKYYVLLILKREILKHHIGLLVPQMVPTLTLRPIKKKSLSFTASGMSLPSTAGRANIGCPSPSSRSCAVPRSRVAVAPSHHRQVAIVPSIADNRSCARGPSPSRSRRHSPSISFESQLRRPLPSRRAIHCRRVAVHRHASPSIRQLLSSCRRAVHRRP